jgi:hypothetical protein
MKLFKTNFLVFVLAAFMVSSCTYRLVDFTMISTKTPGMGIDRSIAVPTEGKKGYFMGFGWNLKDGIDLALENAGTEYDLLIDGVVEYANYPFWTVVKVRGSAINSAKLQASMGEGEFQKWLKGQDVLDPKDIEKAPEN